MNLAAAVKITATTPPSDRVTLTAGNIIITMPASDVSRLVIDQLLRSTELPVEHPATLVAPPPIGQPWPREGGIYAGIARGDAGQPDYYLIVAERFMDPGKWASAIEWATSLIVEWFNDFTLPKRKEQSVLFGNVPELFEKDWYWSGEEHTNNESAWSQHFRHGRQYGTHKLTKLRARAVRRVSIE